MCNFEYTFKIFWKKGACNLDVETFTGFHSYDITDRNILHLMGDTHEQYILLENVSVFEVEKKSIL